MAGHDIRGKVVRHRCDNPPCFRYDHLVVGTQGDNLDDMRSRGRNVPNNVGVTHCKNGHEFTAANTHLQTRASGTPFRRCRACARETAYRLYHRKDQS